MAQTTALAGSAELAPPVRVLVTGAGGPAGVAVIRTLLAEPDIEVHAADIDPYASGLYLVEDGRRWLVPPGAAPEYVAEVRELCRAERIDVVVPTVDAELLPLARARAAFAADGAILASADEPVLATVLDKYRLVQACAGRVHTPRTALLDDDLDLASWTFPVVVKPRRGSGSRGFSVVESPEALAALGPDDTMIVQEYLPGDEYSLDVLADLDGRVVAVVPRERLRVDSGVSVAGRTLHDPELDTLARQVAAAVGLTLVSNVQCRRDRAGRAALLEVNPRFPGAMPLTVHSGVNMPRLCLAAVLGRPLPETVPHRDTVMVRFLEERFPEPAQLARPLARAGR
jgi:carbamoyl-phosphate synthase large subunit